MWELHYTLHIHILTHTQKVEKICYIVTDLTEIEIPAFEILLHQSIFPHTADIKTTILKKLQIGVWWKIRAAKSLKNLSVPHISTTSRASLERFHPIVKNMG